MSNDMIRLAMEQAARRFGSRDVFNAANFSAAFGRMCDVRGTLDGHWVRGILCGRDDVEVLRGGAHFRVLPRPAP